VTLEKQEEEMKDGNKFPQKKSVGGGGVVILGAFTTMGQIKF